MVVFGSEDDCGAMGAGAAVRDPLSSAVGIKKVETERQDGEDGWKG